MGKKSRLKRERREGKLASENKPVSLFDSMPTVPADMIISSLILKFIGKSGYKYISISRYGALFMNENCADIAPVMLHREFPELSVRGRYNDPNRNDIVLYAVHVPKSFVGMVIDKHANVYLTGNPETVATPEEVKNVLCDLTKVTAEEFNAALEAERPLIEGKLKELHDKVEKDVKSSVKDLDAAEKQLNDPYGNVVTDPYGNFVDTDEPIEEGEEAEVISNGDEAPPTLKEMSETKDAEVVE